MPRRIQIRPARPYPAARRPGPRGLGQVMPTCAQVDATQTVPQMVLLGGGSLAMVVGIIGAVFSEQYREEFAIAAGVGLVANVAGGIWAGSSIAQNLLNPQCTGPGLPALGPFSVNPDQTTPTGQVEGLLGPYTPTTPGAPATAQNLDLADGIVPG